MRLLKAIRLNTGCVFSTKRATPSCIRRLSSSMPFGSGVAKRRKHPLQIHPCRQIQPELHRAAALKGCRSSCGSTKLTTCDRDAGRSCFLPVPFLLARKNFRGRGMFFAVKQLLRKSGHWNDSLRFEVQIIPSPRAGSNIEERDRPELCRRGG